MKITGLICPTCKYVIYSRARHDFRSCFCGGLSIDGGFDYMKVSWDENKAVYKDIQEIVFEFPQEKKDLFADYRLGEDKYGCCPIEDFTYNVLEVINYE